MAVRTHLKGTVTVLQGLDIVGVYESSPVHFSVRLLRPVTAFNLPHEEEQPEAMPTLSTDCAAQLTVQRLYMDGQWISISFTADMLPFEDGTTHQAAALGRDADGARYGSGAAASLTGAIASSDSAGESLFRNAGIVRCFSREELTTVGCVFTLPELKGKNFAIITHAGGP